MERTLQILLLGMKQSTYDRHSANLIAPNCAVISPTLLIRTRRYKDMRGDLPRTSAIKWQNWQKKEHE